MTPPLLVKEIKCIMKGHLRVITKSPIHQSFNIKVTIVNYFGKKFESPSQIEKELLGFLILCLKNPKVNKVKSLLYLTSMLPNFSYSMESSKFHMSLYSTFVKDSFLKDEIEYIPLNKVESYIKTKLHSKDKMKVLASLENTKAKPDLRGLNLNYNNKTWFLDLDRTIMGLVRVKIKVVKNLENWFHMVYDAGNLKVDQEMRL